MRPIIWRSLSLLFTFLTAYWSTACAEITEPEKQALKQEFINELLQSELIKHKIENEINAYQAKRTSQTLAHAHQKQTDLLNRFQTQLRPIAGDRDRIYGNADALISLIEFADFDCPYCRKIHPVLKRLVDESKGKVNWIFRHFPLSRHKPNALQEAEAAECAGALAGQAGFWKFSNALFFQPRRGITDSQTVIDRAALAAKLDKASILACIDSEKFKSKVEIDEDEALKLGIQGTPATVVTNNKTGQILFHQGAVSLKTLSSSVDKLLEINK